VSVLPGARALLGLALAYFALHLLVRLAIASALELDEAEQLVLTQQLAWGYGRQAPLYTWLLALVFRLVGVTPLALALLKSGLLLAAYAFVYRSARLVTGRADHAAVAAVSLLFVPQIAWESQRDLTHTVLAVAAAAATLFFFLRACEAPAATGFVALGATVAVGFLAKGSYAFFLGGLALAAVTVPRARAVLLDARMLLAVGVAAALLAPHARWLLDHRDIVPAAAQDVGAPGRHLAARVAGLADVARATVVLAAVPVAVFAAITRPWAPPPPRVHTGDYERLIGRAIVAALALEAVVVLALGMTVIRARWMQPVVVALPVLLTAALRDRLDEPRRRRLFALGLVAAGAIVVAMAAHLWLLGLRGEPSRLDAPFERLAGEMRPLVARADVIVTENRWLGGNLRLQFPGKTVVVPEWPALVPRRAGPCLLVWQTGGALAPPSPELRGLAGLEDGAARAAALRLVEAPYRFQPHSHLRLGVLLSECRPDVP
jgi:4-amino-4-deoxy-L-arabinose transferase-like glycosyltransferase